jgi:hypothetical protein
MKQPEKELTAKQRHWLHHIESSRASRQSIPEYARKHKLSAPQLYTWTSRLRQLGVLDGNGGSIARSRRSRPRVHSHPIADFSPVRLVEEREPSVGMRIRFANGVILELGGTIVPDSELLTTLASLP